MNAPLQVLALLCGVGVPFLVKSKGGAFRATLPDRGGISRFSGSIIRRPEFRRAFSNPSTLEETVKAQSALVSSFARTIAGELSLLQTPRRNDMGSVYLEMDRRKRER